MYKRSSFEKKETLATLLNKETKQKKGKKPLRWYKGVCVRFQAEEKFVRKKTFSFWRAGRCLIKSMNFPQLQ